MKKEVLSKYLNVPIDKITKTESNDYSIEEDLYQVLSEEESDQYLIDEEGWIADDYNYELDKICPGIIRYIDWEQYWIDSGLSIIDFDFEEFYYNNEYWYIRKF